MLNIFHTSFLIFAHETELLILIINVFPFNAIILLHYFVFEYTADKIVEFLIFLP